MTDASFAKLQESVNGLDKAVDDLIRDNRDLLAALRDLLSCCEKHPAFTKESNAITSGRMDKARAIVARIEGARQ